MRRIDNDLKRYHMIIKRFLKQKITALLNAEDFYKLEKSDIIPITIPITIPQFQYETAIPQFQYETGKLGGVGQGNEEVGNPAPFNHAPQHTTMHLTIEDITNIIIEDLALPSPDFNKQCTNRTYSHRRTYGPRSLRTFRTSYLNALKRQCQTGNHTPESQVIINSPDMRYKYAENTTSQNNPSLLILIRDTGHRIVDAERKRIRNASYWIENWLCKHSPTTKTIYLGHDERAHLLTKEEYYTASIPGTCSASTAINLATTLIATRYQHCNSYPFYFSDGRTDTTKKDLIAIIKLTNHTSYFGYIQVYSDGSLLKTLNDQHNPTIHTTLYDQEDKLYNCLRELLGKK